MIGTWSHRHLVYPSVLRLRGESAMWGLLEQMQDTQYAPTEQLCALQDGALARLLDHAFAHSPYYRAFAGTGPTRLSTARARFKALPFLTKEILQESAEFLRSVPHPSRVTRKTTGGSTGQAVTVYKDPSAIAAEMAASWRGYGWFGLRVGDRAARFWGAPHTVKRRLRFLAADLATNRIRFSAFAFDDADLERYWRRCMRFRPRYFYGYVSMLEAFADFVRRKGYDGHSLGLAAIVTTSEVLSLPQRQLLMDVFGARVQNEYGCGEVGPIAYECNGGSLHLMAENLLVEVLRADGTPARVGETGEIVVTDLNNYAMPLIRYRVADHGVLGEPCACGRTLPVLAQVWGRAYDFVLSPSGRRYHGEFFMYLFEDLRAAGIPVRQFQVLQSGPGSLEVRVAEPVGSEHAISEVRRQFWQRIPEFDVTIVRVPHIERAPSGKMRVIVNPWLELQGQSQISPPMVAAP